VDLETCETAGDMDAKLAAEGIARRPDTFPYANWGPAGALLGFLLALVAGALLATVFSPFGLALQQFGLELALLLVPVGIALGKGARSLPQALERLGVRRFRLGALKWMAATVGAYLLFAAIYASLFGAPHQEDIADKLGIVPIQVLLIVIAAPIGEEVCFRGMLFGGLRERLPRLGAALLSGLIFGGLHAISGIEAVPPLVVFGFLLALLYEKTGSVIPGILLHVLNNCAALLSQ
jgi:uncharacterized protein